MTTSKKLVPLTQPLHVIIDGDGGGGGEAKFISLNPLFLEDYGENLDRFNLFLTEATGSTGFVARGSVGEGVVGFIMPLGPTWDFRLKVRDASITVNESLVFTLYNDDDEVINSYDYRIQWMDFGDGGYQTDVSGIQLTEISGIEDASYVTITLVSPGSE